MSKTTQNDFESLVNSYFSRHLSSLCLSKPIFNKNGFITTATMAGSGGRVEIRCGPAEYHAEIFIYTKENHKRWSLSDLMSIEHVRVWMMQNRPNTAGRSRLDAEIDCAFCLLIDGLKGAGFEWILER
jgi:hypothetical protein